MDWLNLLNYKQAPIKWIFIRIAVVQEYLHSNGKMIKTFDYFMKIYHILLDTLCTAWGIYCPLLGALDTAWKQLSSIIICW